MNHWYRILISRLKETATSKWGIWILFLSAFADASFLPLPVTTYFVFLVIMTKEKSNSYIVSVLLGTVLGSVAGYSIGYFVLLNTDGDFSAFGKFLFNNIPGFSEGAYYKAAILLSRWNFWILIGSAATPVPYGIFSIFSGAFKINIFIFLIATVLSQGLKFYLVAISTLKLGTQVIKIRRVNWRPVVILTSAFIGAIVFISNIFKNLFQIN